MLLALLSLCVGSLTAQRTTFSATLAGTSKNTRLVFSEARGGKLVPTDTLTLDAKGHLKLQREVSQPLFGALALMQDQGPVVHLLLLPGERVTADLTYMPAINFLKISNVKGSDNMDLYRQYSDLASDAMLNNRPEQVGERLAPLLASHSDLLMSAFLVTFYESAFDQFAPLYRQIRDTLAKSYASNEFVQHLDSKLRASLTAGDEAPDIALPDPDGNVRRLSDLRGRLVLIDFWASWCRPCRMENPNVVRLYERYHNYGFEVFSVSLDNNRDAWLKAINDDHLSWPNHVSDLRGWSSAGGRLYGIQSIPATVLVAPDGKILARNLRGPDLENALNQIFGQK